MKNLYQLYNEPYRNQFHYSAPIGWINDINGCWYINNLYHIAYQHTCNSTSCMFNSVSIGHACSKDLLHWQTCPDIIAIGSQSVGAAWSGSVLIDDKNRLGYGLNAVVLAYTDTKRGICLAVSTDGGFKFNEVGQNPVLRLSEEFLKSDPLCEISNQRDPKIFWLESEKCFIMAVCFSPRNCVEESCVELYHSTDMIKWEYFQRLSKQSISDSMKKLGKNYEEIEKSWGFLFECPNFFPLYCNDKKYWILHGGDSVYTIGKFEGLHFTISDVPMEPISYGPDFYAGQTFCNINDRTVSIFWMDVWNTSTVETFPFKNSATFPIELTLKETKQGLRIFKQPIRELDMLQESNIPMFENSKDIFLRNWKAHEFDATILIDWEKTTCKSFILKIMERMYRIDYKEGVFIAKNKKFDDAERMVKVPVNTSGILEIRVLADRDSIELFFDGGKYCYTEEFGFLDENITLSLHSCDGGLISASGHFHSLKSIWK